MIDLEPVVDSALDNQVLDGQKGIANVVIDGHILIHDFHVNLVINVLNLEVEFLVVPLRGLARLVDNSRLLLLLQVSEHAVGVHLAEHLCVARQFSLNQMNGEVALIQHLL